MRRFENGYALVIGIAKYAHIRELPPTILNDANGVCELLKSPAYCGYPEGQVKHLINEQASAEDIRAGLDWMIRQTDKEDTAVLFFSGHGGRVVEGAVSNNYLLPFDANPVNLATTALSGEEIATFLQAIPAGRLLAIFDCCHAGGIGDIKALGQFKSGLEEGFYRYLSEGKGRAILASSRDDEVSWVLPDLENSLFTHYLLKALRGQAQTKGDGHIRVFDIFDYVSEQVPARHPFQHPIFKARLENNFPVALYQGQRVQATEKPYIQNIKRLPISEGEHEVLAGMFKDYERLTIKHEFGEGFSKGRVFLVRPIRGPGKAELPAVVKIGPAELIQQEKRAFGELVQHKLPNAMAIVDGAVTQDKRWAALRYPVAGDGQFTIESLKSFARHTPTKDICYILQKRLFRSLQAIWQGQYTHEFYWRDSYDHLLPVNLFVIAGESANDEALELTPETVGKTYEPGVNVVLSGFLITEIDFKAKVITLNLPLSEKIDDLPASFRLRVEVEDITPYRVGSVLSKPLAGHVRDTRRSMLQQYAATALGSDIDLTSATLLLADGTIFPNPIEVLPTLLERTTDVYLSTIHGDLNLENVLVEYDSQTYNVHLIDFASTRQDHVLHDLLRLESEIFLHLLPQTLAMANLQAAEIVKFIEALHLGHSSPTGLEVPFAMLQTIREEVEPYLCPAKEWGQYYDGLIIYLLSALKYQNLDKEKTAPLPKRIAFWGAVGAIEMKNNLGLAKKMVQPNSIAGQEAFMSNRKRRVVHVKVDGLERTELFTSGGSTTIGGRAIGNPEENSGDTEVIVDLKNIKDGRIITTGDHIALLNAIAVPLDQLVGLLKENLTNKDEQVGVEDAAVELLAEAQKLPQQRDNDKVGRALRWLERYISLATLAATQVEQAQQLVDKIQQLLTRG